MQVISYVNPLSKGDVRRGAALGQDALPAAGREDRQAAAARRRQDRQGRQGTGGLLALFNIAHVVSFTNFEFWATFHDDVTWEMEDCMKSRI